MICRAVSLRAARSPLLVLSLVLAVALSGFGCAGYKTCLEGAATAVEKRSCAYAEAYDKLAAANDTRDALILAAGAAFEARLIDDGEVERMREAVEVFDREHDRLTDLLAVAVKAESDPLGIAFGIARAGLELLEAAKAAGVGDE